MIGSEMWVEFSRLANSLFCVSMLLISSIDKSAAQTCTQLSAPSGGGVSCSDGNNLNSNCQFTCNSGYRMCGSLELICQSNSQWSDYEPLCIRKKACSERELNNCDVREICTDTEGGSFTCNCQPGFIRYGSVCKAHIVLSGWSVVQDGIDLHVTPVITEQWANNADYVQNYHLLVSESPSEVTTRIISESVNAANFLPIIFPDVVGGATYVVNVVRGETGSLFSDSVFENTGTELNFTTQVVPDYEIPAQAEIEHDGMVYQFYKMSKTHSEAGESCKRRGAELVSIQNNDLQSKLKKVIELFPSDRSDFDPNGHYDYGFWTSGNNRQGVWVWEDGTRIPSTRHSTDFHMWIGAQPNNAPPAGLILFIEDTYPNADLTGVMGSWLDSPVTDKKYFICQKYGTLPTTTTTTTTPSTTTALAQTCTELSAPSGGGVSCSDGNNLNSKCEFACYNGYRMCGSVELVCQSSSQWSDYEPLCVEIPATTTTTTTTTTTATTTTPAITATDAASNNTGSGEAALQQGASAKTAPSKSTILLFAIPFIFANF